MNIQNKPDLFDERNAEPHIRSTPALNRRLSDVVAEYDAKAAQLDAALSAFTAAGEQIKMAATIGGTFGNVTLDTGHIYDSELRRCLLRSAWRHIYEGLNIATISSANDRRKWESAIENPPAFTIDNIRGTFGNYILDPRANILRGLAETFCALDPFYKSHEKVKIGVKGLPKRVIISNVTGYGSWGRERVRDMLNALAAYRGQPLIEYDDLRPLEDLHSFMRPTSGECVIRGLTIQKYRNGNAHVIFDKAALLDINRALAEFYGDILPDAHEQRPNQRAAGTAVVKDLQFYATPAKVAASVVDDIYVKGKRCLDPSCGEASIMLALRKAGAKSVFGIEIDPTRAAKSRRQGFNVLQANFLEQPGTADFDIITMNPPFYGKHYAKHVRHALDFLAADGVLIAILPATARYDHGLLDDLGGT